MYIPDNYDRFETHMAEQERELQKLPICGYCHKRIMDEYCYELNGEYVHEQCMEENHRKAVEDIVC